MRERRITPQITRAAEFIATSAKDRRRTFPIAFWVALASASMAAVTSALVIWMITMVNADNAEIVLHPGVFVAVLIAIVIGGAIAAIAGVRVAADVKMLASAVSRIDARSTRSKAMRRSYLPLRTPDQVGEVVRTVSELWDSFEAMLQEHRDSRRQIEEAEAYEAEFLTSLSHELRTPLNAILGFTEVLVEEIDGPLNPEQLESLQSIQASGRHLRELVDDVLDLAKLQSSAFSLEMAPTNIVELLREVARILGGQRVDTRGRAFGTKPVELKLEVPAHLPLIEADAKRVKQIVMNLGSNAMKFTREGEVTIGAEYRVGAGNDDPVEPGMPSVEAAISTAGRTIDVGAVLIYVRDTGMGIPRDQLERVFDEFEQLRVDPKNSRRQRKGAGLGLAICKRLTELHQGRIWAESEVGRGSTFYLEIPVIQEEVG